MKNFIFVLILISKGSFVFGQQNKLDIGLEGGPNYSFLRGNDFIKKFNDPRVGYLGGLSIQYNFSKLISIRTGVAMERKGSSAKGIMTDVAGNEIGTFSNHSQFDYLSIPLLVRLSLGKKIKYFLNAGPYLSYLIKETNITQGTGYPETILDQTKQYKPWDVGISAGLGISVPIGKNLLISCELRNNLGLINISEVPVYNDGTIKTNASSLLLGIAYRFGTAKL